ncbi:hypothetical protein [Jeotgalibacillus aurantiacus]|uniref:hypothetical protein n=1 Tax=Jeotgalibacillus aurantiacus TaxID=2763266 RepID=UPI001D0A6C51|nr:hypothetical protein [Jeotgalibacillus aurantiacus]
MILKGAFFIITAILLVFVLVIGVMGKPPLPTVMAGKYEISVMQGPYCWKNLTNVACVSSPLTSIYDIGLRSAPVEVKSGERIYINVKGEKMFSVDQWISRYVVQQPEWNGSDIIAPDEPGIYIYHIHAEWEEGSGGFTFAIRVVQSAPVLITGKIVELVNCKGIKRFL